MGSRASSHVPKQLCPHPRAVLLMIMILGLNPFQRIALPPQPAFTCVLSDLSHEMATVTPTCQMGRLGFRETGSQLRR